MIEKFTFKEFLAMNKKLNEIAKKRKQRERKLRDLDIYFSS